MTDAKTNPAAKPLRIAGQHLAARTDQQSPQHVRYEPYYDEDEEYLYRSQTHSHIMPGPGRLGKPHTDAKASGRGKMRRVGSQSREVERTNVGVVRRICEC
jgi:hypothetical protein